MTRIVIVGGAGSVNWPNLFAFKEETVTWIGVDRGTLHLLEKGITPHVAVGDFDSLSAKEFQQVSQIVSDIRTAPPEKDETDTQLALTIALNEYPEQTITLVGMTGGRLDHFLANLWMPLEPRFRPFLERIEMRDAQNTITYFHPGRHVIEKEQDKKYLAFVCLTPVAKLTLEEVKYELKEYDVSYPMSFASNEFLSNKATFSFETGIMAVIQSKD